ncbi:TatD family hydrolase [Salmonella enterica]|uniref:TatD family hydrolase n=1 Tax=Salmonella enterica TaxID=28901 RepID=UPI001E5F03A8|nr:TatD family hydrolase [Salmonella enterica]
MSWRFIDTHCHFDFPPFTGDERASIQRGLERALKKSIRAGDEAAALSRVLARRRVSVAYAAAGIAPHCD